MVLVDTDSTEPYPDILFAMDFGDEVQLRRIVRRLDGKIELVHINPAWPDEPGETLLDAPILGSVSYVFGAFCEP